jgi:hypothetical protein
MSGAKDVVVGFQAAMRKDDWSGARTHLADRIDFVGPFDKFSNPEEYLQALQKIHPIVERVDMHRMFVDGDDVCMIDLRSRHEFPGRDRTHSGVASRLSREDRSHSGRVRRAPILRDDESIGAPRAVSFVDALCDRQGPLRSGPAGVGVRTNRLITPPDSAFSSNPRRAYVRARRPAGRSLGPVRCPP